jgi:hypothetical protein
MGAWRTAETMENGIRLHDLPATILRLMSV